MSTEPEVLVGRHDVQRCIEAIEEYARSLQEHAFDAHADQIRKIASRLKKNLVDCPPLLPGQTWMKVFTIETEVCPSPRILLEILRSRGPFEEADAKYLENNTRILMSVKLGDQTYEVNVERSMLKTKSLTPVEYFFRYLEKHGVIQPVAFEKSEDVYDYLKRDGTDVSLLTALRPFGIQSLVYKTNQDTLLVELKFLHDGDGYAQTHFFTLGIEKFLQEGRKPVDVLLDAMQAEGIIRNKHHKVAVKEKLVLLEKV